MFNWIDKVYKNARKRVFKNLDTGEILNLEVQDDPSNVSKESPTPLTAHCLNLAQQELVDDMSKIYMGMNITADTVQGLGRTNKTYGVSKQTTRSGRNKLPNNATNLTSNGLTFTINKDKSVTINGTATAQTDLILFGKYNSTTNKIPLNGQVTYGLKSTNNNIRLILVKDGSTQLGEANSSKTIAVDNIFVNYAIIRVTQGATIPNQTFYPMIVQGDSLGEYEEYGASPSLEYPAPIHCLGDDVNLFDEKFESGTLSSTDGTSTSNSTRIRSINYNNITPGASYIFNCNGMDSVIVFEYDKNKAFLKSSGFQTLPYIFTASSNMAFYKLVLAKNNSPTITANDVSKAKLQKGTVATPWSPYGYGTVENISSNKNLAKLEAEGKYRIYHSGEFVASSSFDSYIAKVSPNTTYCTSNVHSNICFFDKNMKYIKGDMFRNAGVFNTNGIDNVFYATVAVEKANKDKVQIEEGEAATDYVAHQESSNIVYVDKPLCSLGNVRDELDYARGKITRRLAYEVFDGSDDEGWATASSGYQTDTLFCAYLSISKMKIASSMISNRFKSVVGATNQNYELVGSNAKLLLVKVLKSRLTTPDLAGFKTWLASNPFEAVYELATPIIEDIECSNKIIQYDGQTTVYNRDNSEIEVSLTNNKAISEINENINNIESNIRTMGIYSTEEQVVGRWIDGKTLYKKMIELGNLPNETSKNIEIRLSNASFVKMEGYAIDGLGSFIPLPFVSNTLANNVGISIINNSYIVITTGIDRSKYRVYVTVYYTKTTD